MEEQWAQVVGFPDYAVSNHGRVVSLRYDRELTPRTNSYGYNRVALYRDRERHEKYVHQLVAAAFTTGYAPGTIVRHINENNNDNVMNLKFGKGARMGHLIRRPRTPLARHVRIIQNDMVFRTVEDCAKYLGTSPSCVYRVLRGERETYRGLRFEYLDLLDV